MTREHADNPQRIYDDCVFMMAHISNKIALGHLDDGFGVKRLLNALSTTNGDIFTYSDDVQSVVLERQKTQIVEPISFSQSQESEIAKALAKIHNILSDKLEAEILSDSEAILAPVMGGERAKALRRSPAALYRMASRFSRMYLDADKANNMRSLSEAQKLSIVQAQPHFEQVLTLLKPFLKILPV